MKTKKQLIICLEKALIITECGVDLTKIAIIEKENADIIINNLALFVIERIEVNFTLSEVRNISLECIHQYIYTNHYSILDLSK